MNLIAMALVATLAAEPTGIKVVQDIPYGEDEVLQSLDLYFWERPPKMTRSVVVYIHGGGWSEGDKASPPGKGEFFASHNFLYAAVNYRLSPKVAHPAHVQDVARAVAWVHRNARRYGGNPERIFLVGHSAGAHLAALLATDPRYLRAEGVEPSILAGVVLLDGSGYDVRQRMAAARGWSKRVFEAAFGRNPKTWIDASPLHHVSKDDVLPPFLLFHVVERPASTRQAKAFAQKLKKSGAQVELVPVRDRDHVTIDAQFPTPEDPVGTRLMEFLRKYRWPTQSSESQGATGRD